MNYRTLFHRSSMVLISALTLGVSACSKQAPTQTSKISAQNVVSNNVPSDSLVGEFRVIRNDRLAQLEKELPVLLTNEKGEATKFLKARLKAGAKGVDERVIYKGKYPTDDTTPTPVDTANDTLMLGLPLGSLGEERALGAVITAVSNTKNTDLGNLKLSDFPMIHGKLMLAALDTSSPQMILVGCVSKCSESSPRIPLVSFPIVAVDADKDLMMIDLSAVGKSLDLISIEDPTGQGTGLRTVSAVAKSFDYSEQTVVFDIESKLTAADPVNNPTEDTNLTVRWYLRSSAAFDSAFESRPATNGVGYFMTDYAKEAKIRRFSLARYGDAGIKYYVKHVPAEYQAAFASAFDEWNDSFKATFGRPIFDYEFIPEGDARNDLLVPGDIRYNIVEWDTVNLASYGGLGPSEGNEYTGEDISANVLIQGPTVLKLYTDWYKVSDQVKALQAQGKAQEADLLLKAFSQSQDAAMNSKVTHELKLNHTGKFRIHAEVPALSDPLAQRNDFDELPPNVSFKDYMYGYFHDMLTHELGHNLGLRHNFRGNMGATDTGLSHSPSRSVMEYLGRRYRYLDGVGEYDIMALKYGYGNVKPAHTDWFCTDENKWSAGNLASSPECSADDATADPFSFYEMRLSKSLDYLLARGQSYAPVWKLEDMARELGVAISGLKSYALVNDANISSITNFAKSGRPVEAKGFKDYVVAQVKQQICDPNLEIVIYGKYDPAAQKATRDNLNALREKVISSFSKVGVDIGVDVNCAPVTKAVLTSI